MGNSKPLVRPKTLDVVHPVASQAYSGGLVNTTNEVLTTVNK